MSGRAAGFTLIEVLVALVVVALIAALSYAALGPAGEGFRMLADARDAAERDDWVGRRLRADVAGLTASAVGDSRPLRIVNDNRGDVEFDQCWLQTRMPGRPGVWLVHYFIDEREQRLMREMRLLWARPEVEPERWDMGEAGSLAVEAMDERGAWRQEWRADGAFAWPRALRFRLGTARGERVWVLPVLTGKTW